MTEQSDGIVYGFAATHDRLFAACGAGLFQSADEGRNWTSAGDSLPTTAVAASPDFAHDGTLFASVGGMILRSVDGGARWNALQLAQPQPVVGALAVSPNYAADGVALAATIEDGVFRSADRGRSWSPWNFGLLDLNTICLTISPSFADDETIFVGTESGLFRSANGGRAWREVVLPVEYPAVMSVALSPNFARDGIGYAGTESGELLTTSDGGESWRGLPVGTDGSPISSILLDGVAILLNLGDALKLSTDGGASWQTRRTTNDMLISALIAPSGLSTREPLIVGFIGGAIRRLE
jgi:photosystem II stability/assembly factor-like uncharacterized protein